MKQSGIWGFMKKPASSSTTEPQLTAFRPGLASHNLIDLFIYKKIDKVYIHMAIIYLYI